jgi:hypothetical protein
MRSYKPNGRRPGHGALKAFELPKQRKPPPNALAIVARLTGRDLLLRGGSRAGWFAAAAAEQEVPE